MVLVSSISNIFTNKTSLANKWTSFSSSNLALAISKYRKQIVKLLSCIIMCIHFSLICPILETMPEIFKENRWLFGRFEDTKIPFWDQLTLSQAYRSSLPSESVKSVGTIVPSYFLHTFGKSQVNGTSCSSIWPPLVSRTF